MSTLDQEIEGLKEWSSPTLLSLSLRNCTGTINGGISYQIRSDKKAILINGGRIYISNFSRTTNNPGFNFTRPTDFPSSGTCTIGHRGESAAEIITLGFSTNAITTTETFTNCSGTRLTFVIYTTIIYL